MEDVIEEDKPILRLEFKETITVIRFFIGCDYGKTFTPFDQFYVYHKDDIKAEEACDRAMRAFRQQWQDTDPFAPLEEIKTEIVSPHRITAGFWMDQFKGKSMCSVKHPHVPKHILDAQKVLKDFEAKLNEEWIEISKLDYTHTDDIILDGDVFTVGDKEVWREQNLKDLLDSAKHLPLSVKRTATRGYGLFAQSSINAFTVLGQYSGELLDIEDALKREDDSYQFWAGSEFKIDGKFKGNLTRFINHICDGKHSECNVAVDVITNTGLEGFFRIIMYSKRNIKAGDELLFNYKCGVMKRLREPNEEQENEHKIRCMCPCVSSHAKYPFVF